MPLTREQVRELLAKKRVKGVYEDKLFFLLNDSDEPGVDVVETWPIEFTVITDGKRVPKTANTLYQGFRNASEKLKVEDQVDIINRDGHVYILVKSRVEEYTTDTTDVEINDDVEELATA